MDDISRQDTIFALATAPGKGGVAVLRVSGPDCTQSLCALTNLQNPAPRHAYYCTLRDDVSRETIDRGLVLYFAAPHSFTGEYVCEYHVHGGLAVVDQMLSVLARQPRHRLAQPGEFTRRAFENGKMDLTAAEAIADLVDAETTLQKSQALSQLEGGLGALYQGWADELKKALAHLEADLEFPDEDLPEGVAPQVLPVLQDIYDALGAHLDDNRRGEMLRNGVRVAVIGAPNAGKSSLVNALARRDVAIVSVHAGTTRDVIEAHLDLGGYPVILADTAGLRPELLGGGPAETAQDHIESEGIQRALERAQQADIKLLLFDASALPARDAHTAALIDERALVVYNKADIHKGHLNEGDVDNVSDDSALLISAQDGSGLDSLQDALVAKIKSLMGRSETPSLTRRRHRAALEEARVALERAFGASLPELMAEDVRLAVRALGRITGRVDVEDLLDVIFKDFCIGK